MFRLLLVQSLHLRDLVERDYEKRSKKVLERVLDARTMSLARKPRNGNVVCVATAKKKKTKQKKISTMVDIRSLLDRDE